MLSFYLFFLKKLSPFDFAAILVHRNVDMLPFLPPVPRQRALRIEPEAMQILRGRMHMEAINVQAKLVTQVLCLKMTKPLRARFP